MAIGLSDPATCSRAHFAMGAEVSGRNYLKTIVIIGFCVALVGCGKQSMVPPQQDEMIQLEEKNSRLEAELTELREAILSEKRKAQAACNDNSAKHDALSETASHINKQDPEPNDMPPELAVVRLEPERTGESAEAEADPDFGQNLSSPGSPNSDEPIDESTRPVLKVHGRHEAWVYHRPLDAADAPAQ